MCCDHSLHLENMLSSCRKVIRYVRGLKLDELTANEMFRDAVLFNLQIIGESASQVCEEDRMCHPEIDWLRLDDLRSIIDHGRFTLDEQVFWNLLQTHLPRLQSQLERILPSG